MWFWVHYKISGLWPSGSSSQRDWVLWAGERARGRTGKLKVKGWRGGMRVPGSHLQYKLVVVPPGQLNGRATRREVRFNEDRALSVTKPAWPLHFCILAAPRAFPKPYALFYIAPSARRKWGKC